MNQINKADILKGIKEILLIQLGDIGDLVWMTPTIRAIKKAIPHSNIRLMAREGFGSLLRDDPALSGIFEVRHYQGNVFRRIGAQIRFLKELRAIGADLAIDFRAGDRGAFMALLSGAPKRVSQFYGDSVPFWRNCFFTDIVKPPTVHARGAAEQTLRIVRELGIETDDIRPKLYVSDTVMAQSKALIGRAGLGDSIAWLTINPFSRWAYKELPEKHWIEIIQWLKKDLSLATVIIGSKNEKPAAERLVRACPGNGIVNLAGETTLAELAGVLSLSRLHVGVDSAAPHIAAAVGTPTVTVYGPTSWRDWAPVGEGHRVVAPDMACAPCHSKGCDGKGRSRCLEELDWGRVKAAIQEALSESRQVKKSHI